MAKTMFIVFFSLYLYGCMHGNINRNKIISEKLTPSLCNKCEKEKPFYINGQWLK